ncbi:hypothetical protein MFIFM68171_09885 [Madurella fahalii]|uniref:Rhodopsin domain-containing protein n=1 Tax=Madurella fahalii TaxID=1157608 RepID=A0ABQ0GPM4_9PEZI
MNSTTPGGLFPGPSASDLPHDDTGPNMIAAAFTTWSIAAIFVALRLWTRALIIRKLGLADLFIVLSLVAAAGMCISMLIEVKNGMGKHVWDIDIFVQGPPMLEAWWFSVLTYILALGMAKISICMLYLTIFTLEWARRACYGVLFIVVISNLWSVATILTHCIPLEAAWDWRVKATFCQGDTVWWASTALIIATDVMVFTLPIPMVLPLKLPRRQKVAVVGVFAVGFFVCLVSMIRLIILVQAKAFPNPDFTYTGTDLTYWTVIETHTAIAIACTMTLKPLVARLFPRLLVPGRNSEHNNRDRQPSTAPTGSGPPLTIGSMPLRSPLAPSHARMESWMDAAAVAATTATAAGGARWADVAGAPPARDVEEGGAGPASAAAAAAAASGGNAMVGGRGEWAAETQRNSGASTSTRTAVTVQHHHHHGLDDKVSVPSSGGSTVNVGEVEAVSVGQGGEAALDRMGEGKAEVVVRSMD